MNPNAESLEHRADEAVIRRTLDLLAPSGQVAELRSLGPGRRVASGYYDNHKQLARDAVACSGQARGVYITMNRITPDLLARSANQMRRAPKHTTSDADIISRDWLMIDFDPIRPADVSATDLEHEAALTRAKKCTGWLIEHGITPDALVRADSGNGAHILLRVGLPNDAESYTLVKSLLAAIDLRFSDEHVQVDVTTGNPSRLCKIYGTLAAKGDSTPERPHRLARLLDVPSAIAPAPNAVLHQLAALNPRPESKEHRNGHNGFDLEQWIKKHGLDVVKSGPWNGAGRKYVLARCPWNAEHTDRSAYIVQHPGGGIAAGCHHNGCAGRGWAELRTLLEPDWQQNQSRAPTYESRATGLVYNKSTKDGPVPVPLTNFRAKIVGDIVMDDGVDEDRHFEIEAELEGQRPRRLAVPASKFASMNWVPDHLGPRAIVYPGYVMRDRARAAIQELSPQVETRRVYAHLGWRKIDGKWYYLHSDGAIGEGGTLPGTEVGIPADLDRYCLPDPPMCDELKEAIKHNLFVLELVPDEVAMPIYAAIWSSVVRQPDFSLHVTGPTGGGKSALAALAQAHWGRDFDAKHLPAHWSSTANALERLAFCAKDVLLVVDDFAPSGTSADVARLHRDADRLFRGAGNQGGRARLTRESKLRKTLWPRALILSTGEDVPRGQSLRARLAVVELGPHQMDWKRLSVAQHDAAAGMYTIVMSGFARWVAQRRDALDRWIAKRHAELREYAYADGRHRRTPDIVANLAVGFEVFTMFCREVGVFENAWEDYWSRCWDSLGAVAAAQAAHHRSQEPVHRYVQLLGAGILSGRCNVASRAGASPDHHEQWGWRVVSEENRPQGDRIGWIDGDDVYLEPDVSYAVARRIASETGENLGLTQTALQKALWDKGLLESREVDRLTVYRTVEGHRRRVLHLRAEKLREASDGSDGPPQNELRVPELSAPIPPDTAPAEEPGAEP